MAECSVLDLIDEISLLITPVADGRQRTAALFDVDGNFAPARLSLISIERRPDDILWLRYRVQNEAMNGVSSTTAIASMDI